MLRHIFVIKRVLQYNALINDIGMSGYCDHFPIIRKMCLPDEAFWPYTHKLCWILKSTHDVLKHSYYSVCLKFQPQSLKQKNTNTHPFKHNHHNGLSNVSCRVVNAVFDLEVCSEFREKNTTLQTCLIFIICVFLFWCSPHLRNVWQMI